MHTPGRTPTWTGARTFPLLARWQRAHPRRPLYLDYFGPVRPRRLRIRYFNLPGGYEYGPPPTSPQPPGVVAISSSYLRMLTAYDKPPAWFAAVKGRQPEEILGGTIYLFRLGTVRG